ncbi:MAG: 50S ribosomal protein L5 [Candidatus Eisenbacteria bacterium]|uniref:Large ribosomal subunit protein uL5 n=1 Tax=Eiseniibacteriota bacterium TaxID=2212470 RepID=A0A849SH97_UNCEI|nr:50S ribosomal protein L5 [Candidatus Eisenbacteria bacterium]
MADDKKDKKDKDAAKAAKPAKTPKAAAKPEGAAKSSKSRGDGSKVAIALSEGRPGVLGKKPRLREHYEQKVVKALMEKFTYRSAMQVPRFQKIVVNMGVGDAITDAKHMDAAVNELAQITGQKPSVRRARKSIANFKLREKLPIGCMVTLRGERMYEFFDRLISVAIPSMRDFRGLSPRSFDGRGNYTFGITEHNIFREIDIDKVMKLRGMDVTIVTSARTDEEGRELLKLMNMPFRQR